MAFVFAEAGTEPMDFQTILKATDEVTTEYIYELTQSRRRLCDALLAQPSSPALLEAIENYLPFLQRLMVAFDMASAGASGDGPKFKWRSTLSLGIRLSLVSKATEKPVVKHPSVYWEGVSVLVAYGVALMNLGAKRAGPSEAQANEAIDYYCRAAGVFRLAAATWAPRIPAIKGQPVCPEMSSEVLQALAEQALGQAQLQAVSKGERKGLSPATLLRLRLGACERVAAAASHLARLPKAVAEELSMALRLWIEQGAIVLDAECLQRHAQLQQEAGQNGIAVACFTHAYNALLPLTMSSAASESPWKATAQLLLPQLDEQARNCAKINNNVTYQPVPPIAEARATLPAAASLVEAKPLNLPPPTEITSKAK